MREPSDSREDVAPGPQTTPLCEIDHSCDAADARGGRVPISVGEHHQLERDVRRRLEVLAGVRFDSLVVRRIPDGVCLQGHAIIDDDRVDVRSAVREVDGVDQVLDRLIAVRRSIVLEDSHF